MLRLNLLALTFAGLVAAFGAASSPARARDLPEILSSRKVIIGVQTDAPPYSLIGDDNQPAGLDIDVAREIGRRLDVPVELLPLTGANRVAYLMSNRVDVVVASLGISPERRAVIGFTRPYLVLRFVMLASKDNPVTSSGTIGNSVVGVTRGTLQDPLITKAAPPGTRIVRYDDDATVAVALATGQIAMMPTGEPVAREIMRQNPSRNFEIKYVLGGLYAGIGVNKDSVALLGRLNEIVSAMDTDGTLGRIFKKWVGSDLPPLPQKLDD